MASPMHLPGCYWLLVHGDRRVPPGLHEVPRPGERYSRTGVFMATENTVEWWYKVDAHVVWLSAAASALGDKMNLARPQAEPRGGSAAEATRARGCW